MRPIVGMFAIASVFCASRTFAPAASAAIPPALIAVVAGDRDVAECAKEDGIAASSFAAGAFKLNRVTLRTGERMSVLEGTKGCVCPGQSCRILIYQQRADGYRRVLDDMTLPNSESIGTDGTLTLPTHESMIVFLEATYVWNGTKYVFSPERSDLYDIHFQQRRPYQIPIRFARGAYSTIVRGTASTGFGEHYVLNALGGQTMMVELLSHSGPEPSLGVEYRGKDLGAVATTHWSGKLPADGIYDVYVSGGASSDDAPLSPFTLRITIR